MSPLQPQGLRVPASLPAVLPRTSIAPQPAVVPHASPSLCSPSARCGLHKCLKAPSIEPFLEEARSRVAVNLRRPEGSRNCNFGMRGMCSSNVRSPEAAGAHHRIVAERARNGAMEYLVVQEPKWQEESHIADPQMLHEWRAACTRMRNAKRPESQDHSPPGGWRASSFK
eukprot:scaffold35213_cov107-Isochrysis_galbana.AAC.3